MSSRVKRGLAKRKTPPSFPSTKKGMTRAERTFFLAKRGSWVLSNAKSRDMSSQ